MSLVPLDNDFGFYTEYA